MTATESELHKSAAKTIGFLIVAESTLDRKARDPHREQAERNHYVYAARDARAAKRALEKFLRALEEG
jgi:gluconate kinase